MNISPSQDKKKRKTNIAAISVSNARQQHDPEVPAKAHVYDVQRCLCLYIRPSLCLAELLAQKYQHALSW